MRLTLPESDRARQRGTSGLATSVLLHTLLIGAAVLGTARAERRPMRPPPALDTLLVYHPPRLPQPPRSPARHVAPTSSVGQTPIPAPMPVPPTTVPTTIPSVDLPLTAIAPAEHFASGLTGDRAADGSASTSGTPGGWDGVHEAPAVEVAVTSRSGNAAPAYPASLRRQRVEGYVIARFVVDTLGRVERASLQVLHADHPDFADAVRAVLPRHRFTAARLDGRAVRQLVEQRFVFALER
ncbi:MAG TPA: energy transducer TonB [Gemmatimonadaceae bacterium]|jgi:TonB family protein|nr:energy transducer TonB [Gemmatimonadaceae bacterium]